MTDNLSKARMSVTGTQRVLTAYFAAMGAEEDFSKFFDPDVTWLMVDSTQEVRGRDAVRAYLVELHDLMTSGEQSDLVVADGHAFLEGHAVNADESHPGLAYCLVYDVSDDSITAMRCYGDLADLMRRT